MDNKLKKLASYYKPYKSLFWADMFFAMLGAAVTLIIPRLVRYITGTVVDWSASVISLSHITGM